MNKLNVEIWSDVVCPFCYIGKRNFENALAQFPYKDQIEITWKSFQLDPTIPENVEDDYEDYLIKKKGFSREQVKGMLNNVTQMAKQVGLDYHLEKAQVANTLKAHQLIQLAKTKQRADEAEERLFKAFFIEGKNIADEATLNTLGQEIGLSPEELDNFTHNEAIAYQVAQDLQEASNIGVTGVPFFVFHHKYAVSGAQPTAVFTDVLEKVYTEWQQETTATHFKTTEGNSCDINGNCD